MYIVDKIYCVLVNKVPGIRERYKKRREQVRGFTRAYAWLYLIGINIAYHVFRYRKIGVIEKYPYFERKKLYTKDSESSLSKKESPNKFAEELLQYDVISFDVFDTLIFRLFSTPSDVFFLVGDELGYMDFKRIRIEMEWKARKKKYKETGCYEVTLEEIYDLLSEETGIEKQKAMEMEFQIEQKVCFANPYIFRVVENLRKAKKRLIITSDMYLSTEQIKKLLENCGYGQFDAYYVSCDINKSKNRGDIYEEIKRRERGMNVNSKISFLHVGDNQIADIEQAEKHGFTSRFYENINEIGSPYRPEDMSVITGGIYRGMVNAHIHSGLSVFTREYEYGYIYGGLFVTGYCQFIHKYVCEKEMDKILFLARDGDILIQAYKEMYPEESEKCEYVYWSRLAATKLAAEGFKYDFFRRFLFHKINQGYSMEAVFSAMEIEDMVYEFTSVTGLKKETMLTDKNVEAVKKYLLKMWKNVLEHYEEQRKAGKLYFSKVLQNCKKAVAIDIGWAGSGAITLNYVVKQIWKMECDITGIIAGTNTCHNAEPDTSETFLQKGSLVSYMYSQRENRDIWKFHDAGKNHNLYWELLLDAPSGSFKGFYLNKKGECECRVKEINTNVEDILQIQRGILDFVKQYIRIQEKLGKMSEICGRDAYAPMLNVEQGRNEDIVKNVSKLLDEKNIG